MRGLRVFVGHVEGARARLVVRGIQQTTFVKIISPLRHLSGGFIDVPPMPAGTWSLRAFFRNRGNLSTSIRGVELFENWNARNSKSGIRATSIGLDFKTYVLKNFE